MARAALIKRDNLYYVNFRIEATNSVMNSPGLHRPGCPGNETGDLHETGVSALSKLNNHITIIFQPLDS